ncbi:MAG: hypothetical protein ACREXU_07935 [Gammaproteobacteria bacterium]
MSNDKHSVPKAVEDCHTLIEWMIPKLDGFPRNRRFTLGERIEGGLLFVLERLVEAAYLRQREEVLKIANLRLDVVRHLAFEPRVEGDLSPLLRPGRRKAD